MPGTRSAHSLVARRPPATGGSRPPFDRIFIIGGPGSGKSSLARRVAARSGLPLYHLDYIARVGGGNGPERPIADRVADTGRIMRQSRWVAEGIDLGWTDQLMDSAEVIVWLDYVSWPQAVSRILIRFVTGALAEARRQRGLRKFTRLRDYSRQVRGLLGAVPKSRDYYLASGTGHGRTEVTRAATAEALSVYESKVVHCRSRVDLETFVRRLR